MALAPTPLKILLGSRKTGKRIHDTLKEEGLLLRIGLHNPQELIARMDQILESHKHSTAQGATDLDEIAQMLYREFLNKKGKNLHQPHCSKEQLSEAYKKYYCERRGQPDESSKLGTEL